MNIRTCILAAALMTAVVPRAEAVTIGIEPAMSLVPGGSLFTLEIVVADLVAGGAPSLSVLDLDVTFDDQQVGFEGATFGDPLLGDQLDLGAGSLSAATPGIGVVNLFALSFAVPDELDLLQAAAFTIATLTFRAQGHGLAPFGFANLILGDALGAPLEAQTVTAVVEVTAAAVPEPSTLLLVLSALAVASHRFRRGAP